MTTLRAIVPGQAGGIEDTPSIPFSLEAEQQLLGALLTNNDVFDRVSQIIKPDHFYHPVHSRIFEICAYAMGFSVEEMSQMTGPELCERFRAQSLRFGTVIHDEFGSAVDLKQRPFTVTTEGGKVFKTQTLIISTGASALYLGLPNEKALQGRGVSACATCDGFFFKNKVVYVVGDGTVSMFDTD